MKDIKLDKIKMCRGKNKGCVLIELPVIDEVNPIKMKKAA